MKFWIVFFLGLSFSAQSSAQAAGWDWKITPYLWAAGIDGNVALGPANAEFSMDFEDIFNVLRGGALVRIEAQSDRYGVSGDLVYLRLKETEAKDTIGGFLEVKLDTLIVEGAYYYRWNEKLALELGLRYWDFETTLRPALLPERIASSDWVDGFAGLRFESTINETWSWLARGNIGAGGADLATGLELDFRRKFASGNTLDVGLRVLDIDYGNSSGALPVQLDMAFAGLTIGYTFNL